MRNERVQKSNMSSTIVALVTDGEKAVAHSGDSRLYYISKREFRRLRTTILSHSEILKRDNYILMKYVQALIKNKLLSSISDIDDLNFDVSEVIDLKKR